LWPPAPQPVHMSFTGQGAGHGKNGRLSERIIRVLQRLGLCAPRAIWSLATADDHRRPVTSATPPRKRARFSSGRMGGVGCSSTSPITSYRPENERITARKHRILLQVWRTTADDLVVICAGYKDRMDGRFPLPSSPKPRSCPRGWAQPHRTFPDYRRSGAAWRNCQLIMAVFEGQCVRRLHPTRHAAAFLRQRPAHFRNAIDRARMRQATACSTTAGSGPDKGDADHKSRPENHRQPGFHGEVEGLDPSRPLT